MEPKSSSKTFLALSAPKLPYLPISHKKSNCKSLFLLSAYRYPVKSPTTIPLKLISNILLYFLYHQPLQSEDKFSVEIANNLKYTTTNTISSTFMGFELSRFY